MSLSPGTKLAHYEILEPIGRGGMGEVYRAKDSKLGRDVAIKVLPDEFAQDQERPRRFQREAKVLASLNHPNIAAIYGLEQSGETHYLVLELVPGETLADRIARGPIPVEEALEIAKKIADALEEAHEQGIVHRDLKPANIKLTADDKVKVLDFGLAKAFAEEGVEGDAATSVSPTITRDATRMGVILGTAAYMSPEQAKGKRVDKRTDIWAFGCVLFEMLSGRKTFPGETVSEIFAEILKGEPEWSRLPGDCPEFVRNLIQRCLTKDPKHRLRDIGDAWVALNEASAPPRVFAAVPKDEGKRYSTLLLVAAALASAFLAALVTAYLRPAPPAPTPTRRFTIHLDERPVPGGHLAISPDGARLAYVARTAEGVRHLVLRHLGENEERVLAGTEDAVWLFFSPDSAWVGFLTIADSQAGANRIGALKKVSVDGGAPVTLLKEVFVGAATWGEDDAIVFQSAPDQKLMRISAVGGAPQPLGLAREDTWYPAALLPGGDALLAMNDAGSVTLFSLKGDEFETVVDAGADYTLYVPTGHVVYFSRGKLLAVPLDRKRLQATGTGVPVAEGVSPFQWAFSREGTLVYGLASKRSLVWVSREGAEEALPLPPDYYQMARVAPDGTRIALSHLFRFVENPDVWVYELARGTMGRLTLDPGVERFPLWSPDGRKVVYISRTDERNLLSKSFDGTSAAELLLTSPYDRWPYSWSRDGEQLVFEEDNPETGSDIGMLSMDGKGTVTPVIRDPFDQTNPAVSPDGRFIAYESNETGGVEVYVQRFPEPGEKRQVSTRGGIVPLWGRDSKELFYRDGESVIAVRIETDPSLRPGESRALFRGDYVHDVSRAYEYVPSQDRFLMMKDDESESDPRELLVVTNWFDELERLAPVK
ncbi:MAG TPA: protein kinase [Vicinamibacteria bacterium]|nr:protein kinase [Vicinamibacteria bacterium]